MEFVPQEPVAPEGRAADGQRTGDVVLTPPALLVVVPQPGELGVGEHSIDGAPRLSEFPLHRRQLSTQARLLPPPAPLDCGVLATWTSPDLEAPK